VGTVRPNTRYASVYQFKKERERQMVMSVLMRDLLKTLTLKAKKKKTEIRWIVPYTGCGAAL